MPPTNSAAWIPTPKARPFQVGPAPYTPPAADQIVIKNGAVAVNPVDGAKQMLGNMLLGYIKHPFILGLDVAGEVVEVGSAVDRFKVGDRVVGNAIGAAPESNNPAEGGFQHYTLLRQHLVSGIPDFLTYEQASVLPLGVVTAVYGLFYPEYLNLELPTSPPAAPDERNEAVVITGGASSVGSCAIQLAVAAGYTVYSTSSPKNFAYVKKLGATGVFDYHNKNWANEVIAELRGKRVAGSFAIGDGAIEGCISILHHSPKDSKRLIAFAGVLISAEQLKTTTGMMSIMWSTLQRVVRTSVLSYVRGVPSKFIEVKDSVNPDCILGTIFQHYLPSALANRHLIPAPAPLVVGTGLDKVQEAVDLQLNGVSAQKVVVSLRS